MDIQEKEIFYSSSNSYSTMNSRTNKTKYIWFVCHGMGYLSRYFLKYFKQLDPEEHYFIAPQAQSKYYIAPEFKHVGASWLTRENTVKETENVMRYFDAVLEKEDLPDDLKINIVGYSQGVSVAMRYLAKRQLNCNHLILMSGGIPKELVAADFEFLECPVTMLYGTKDEFMDDERMSYESKRLHELFGPDVTIVPFDGNHKVNVELINSILS